MTELTPFPHQYEGIDFLLGGGSLLAYDMGLGKSLTALWADQMLSPKLPALISAPSSVMGVWTAELRRIDPGARVRIVDSSAASMSSFYAPADYLIVSGDLPGRTEAVQRLLLTRRYRALICDEADMFKSASALRTQAFLLSSESLASRADRVWLLSGTPAANHVGDLYPLIKATKPDFDMGQAAFEGRYCRFKMARRGNQKVRVIAGTSLIRLPELRKNLNGWWLRKKKSEVLDLPPKFRRVVPLYVKDMDIDSSELVKSPEGRAMKMALAAGDMRLADIGEDGSMSRMRRLLSSSKGKAAAEFTANLHNSGSTGILLWFWHTSGMDAAEKHLRGAGIDLIRIDGSTKRSDRDAFVASFQSPDGPRVALLQIKAAGSGITLIKAENEVFAEASWTPRDNLQAEDRAYRIGQTKALSIDYLCIANSLDMTVMDVVARKTEELSKL